MLPSRAVVNRTELTTNKKWSSAHKNNEISNYRDENAANALQRRFLLRWLCKYCESHANGAVPRNISSILLLSSELMKFQRRFDARIFMPFWLCHMKRGRAGQTTRETDRKCVFAVFSIHEFRSSRSRDFQTHKSKLMCKLRLGACKGFGKVKCGRGTAAGDVANFLWHLNLGRIEFYCRSANLFMGDLFFVRNRHRRLEISNTRG